MLQSGPKGAGFMLYAKNHLTTSGDSSQRVLYLLLTGTGATVWLCIQLCKKESFVADQFPYLEAYVNMHIIVSLIASLTTHIKEELSWLSVHCCLLFPKLSSFLSHSRHKNCKDKGISLLFNVSKTKLLLSAHLQSENIKP